MRFWLNNNVSTRFVLIAFVVLLFTGCNYFEEKEEILPGERVDALPAVDARKIPPGIGRERTVYLPRAVINADWRQQGGDPSHAVGHLQLAEKITGVWDKDIGDGGSSEQVLLAMPVVADGHVFTIDARSLVHAYRLEDGAVLWSRDLSDDDEDALLGGLIAVVDGRVFASTGYGKVFAMSQDSGTILWSKTLPVPIRSGPTVFEDKVFFITIDNQTIALDAISGRQLWSHIGISEAAGILAASNPAAADGLVISAYSSGEVYALRTSNGSVLWSDFFTSGQRFDASSIVSDIAAMPVIDNGKVYIVSFAGRLIALDLRSGQRVWERDIGGIQTPWVVGDYLYMVTNNQHLLCLDRDKGIVLWAAAMQRYEDIEDQEDPITWNGPILAGDRLIVTGSNGAVVSLSPWTGRLLGSIQFGEAFKIAPVVASETLLLLDDDANLRAIR